MEEKKKQTAQVSSPLEQPDHAEQSSSSEGMFNTAGIIKAIKVSLDALGGLLLPMVITCAFPATYLALFHRITNSFKETRNFDKLAIGLPRGHGKTIFIKILIFWAILFTDKRFILVICATQKLSRNILADIEAMLISPNIQKLFGEVEFRQKTQDQKVFKFRGKVVILAANATGGAVRGVNVDNVRPDIIIFDDAQTADCAKSLVQAKEYASWFSGTAMKAKSPSGCTFLYIGNMYVDKELKKAASRHSRPVYCCMLRNLQLSKSWISVVVGGILANPNGKGDEALWEEVQPYAQLMSELADDISLGQANVFWAEVLNDPAAKAQNGFRMDKVELNPYEEGLDGLPAPPPQGRFIVVDPSLGEEKSDALQLTLFEVFDGELVTSRTFQFLGTAPALVHYLIDLTLEYNVPLVACEAYGYQRTLVQWIDYVCEQRGVASLHVVPIDRGMKSKNAAMLTLLKAVMKNEILLHSRVRSAVLKQIRDYDPLLRDNTDDLLDTMYYAPLVVLMHSRDILLPLEASYAELELDSAGELIIPTGDY